MNNKTISLDEAIRCRDILAKQILKCETPWLREALWDSKLSYVVLIEKLRFG